MSTSTSEFERTPASLRGARAEPHGAMPAATVTPLRKGRPDDDSVQSPGSLGIAAQRVRAMLAWERDVQQAAWRGKARPEDLDADGNVHAGLIATGLVVALSHVRGGIVRFGPFVKVMLEDLGEAAKPYLVSWYLAVRNDPRAAAFRSQMDAAVYVDGTDVDDVLRWRDVARWTPEPDEFAFAPEQELTLVPMLARVMDAAFVQGYRRFFECSRFAIERIGCVLGEEVSGRIALHQLQGAYIAMAGRYCRQGADDPTFVIEVASMEDMRFYQLELFAPGDFYEIQMLKPARRLDVR